MKKLILLVIPITLITVIIFVILKVFFLQDLGKGALQVTSKPFSKVYLDDNYIGTTPLCRCESTNMIRNGDYTIRLVPVDGSTAEFQDKITITKGVLTVVDRRFGKGATSEGSIVSLLPLTDKKSSELLVVSFPDKADVFVDTNYQNKSPMHINSITDSDHTLRVKKEGYKDKSVRIRTPAGFKLVAVIYLGIIDDSATISPTPLSSLTGTPVPTISVTPSKTVKVTILQTPNGFLRVRAEPSLTAAEITRVSSGQTFDVLEENTGWFKIKLPNGATGWISAEYAQKL